MRTRHLCVLYNVTIICIIYNNKKNVVMTLKYQCCIELLKKRRKYNFVCIKKTITLQLFCSFKIKHLRLSFFSFFFQFFVIPKNFNNIVLIFRSLIRTLIHVLFFSVNISIVILTVYFVLR